MPGKGDNKLAWPVPERTISHSTTRTLLDGPNVTFNFRHMLVLIAAFQVHGEILAQRLKFGVSLVTTVDDKRSKYSKADHSRAEQARILQKSLMFPASKDLKSWLDKNIIRDCKLGRRDVSAADDVFGPDTAILQGKAME
jgi:hypothetical protein